MIRIDNLKLLMRQRGLKNTDVAQAIKKSDAYVSKLLAGKASFGEKTARNIEEKLGIARNWLDQVHLDADPELPPSEPALEPLTVAEQSVPYSVLPGAGEIYTRFQSDNLIPVITWEQLDMLSRENTARELSGCQWASAEGDAGQMVKWLVMNDRSMQRKFPAGAWLKVQPDLTKITAGPGRFVVVEDKNRQRWVRRYAAVSGEHFQAEALEPGFATLDSERDGLRVIAVVYQALVDC